MTHERRCDVGTIGLARVVAENLLFLRDEWNPGVTQRTLRITSTVLRALLVENYYGKAWRTAGFDREPTVEAQDLDRALAGRELARVSFAQAGGRISDRLTLTFSCNYRGPVVKSAAETRHPVSMKLSEFRRTPALVVNGTRISRVDVVKFVANKCGGAHFQPDRKAHESVFRLLDEYNHTAATGHTNTVFFTLLLIGRALAGSTDASRYIARVLG